MNKITIDDIAIKYFGTNDYKSVLLTLTTYDVTVQKFKKEVESYGFTLETE